jgi:prevent-host-death family protein
MKKASITEAKNNLSALIDGLKGGGSSVLIMDRGRPVARLQPVEHEYEARLAGLVREGLVRPRRGPLPRMLLTTPPPAAKGRASVLEALLEERREGR